MKPVMSIGVLILCVFLSSIACAHTAVSPCMSNGTGKPATCTPTLQWTGSSGTYTVTVRDNTTSALIWTSTSSMWSSSGTYSKIYAGTTALVWGRSYRWGVTDSTGSMVGGTFAPWKPYIDVDFQGEDGTQIVVYNEGTSTLGLEGWTFRSDGDIVWTISSVDVPSGGHVHIYDYDGTTTSHKIRDNADEYNWMDYAEPSDEGDCYLEVCAELYDSSGTEIDSDCDSDYVFDSCG